MARSFEQTLRWLEEGSRLCIDAVESLSEGAFDAPSGLAGWSRKHLVAHLAANAEACGRLVHWAATGEPTPMYPSADARSEGIENGSLRSAADLRVWLASSAAELAEAMGALTAEQWRNEIVTGRGRRVEATEVVWMRAREVCLHSVDLAAGVTVADLPADFLAALCDDAAEFRSTGPVSLELVTEAGRWRIGSESPTEVIALSLADATSYLVGRRSNVGDLPELPAWI